MHEVVLEDLKIMHKKKEVTNNGGGAEWAIQN